MAIYTALQRPLVVKNNATVKDSYSNTKCEITVNMCIIYANTCFTVQAAGVWLNPSTNPVHIISAHWFKTIWFFQSTNALN